MNSEVYINILDNNMFSTLWQQFGIGPIFYQHNNASSVHKAEVIASGFKDIRVDVMIWSATRDSLNSIEHLWDELDRRLRARFIRPKYKQELFTMLQEECK